MRTGKLTLVILMAASAALGCGDSKSSTDGGAGRDGSATGGTGGTAGTTAAGGTAGTSAAGGTAGTSAAGGTAGTTAAGGTAGTAAGGTAGTTAAGGAGGTTATGGMGGTSATGGTGGASAMCEVPCLTNLFSNCTPMGTCMSQFSLMPIGSNQCYSNGVKVSSVLNASAGGAGTYTITYSKMGQTCYSIEVPVSGANQQTFTFTYKNAAGTAVATGTYEMAMNKFTVMCTGGMTYDLSNPACTNVPRGMPMGGAGGMGSDCPMGTCQ